MKLEHRVDVEGLSLHVEESGSGRPIVFGHSLLCDGSMFVHQVQELSKDHRVLNVDFRGHGRSGVPQQAYTIRDQAADYLRVLDALQVERAVIAGLSMGGMAGLHLALEHPQRVAGLVLMDTSADRQAPWSTIPRFRAMALIARYVGLQPFILKEVAQSLFGATFRREHPHTVELWLEKIAKLDRAGLYRAVNMVVSRPALTDAQLAQIRVPALVLVGEEDTATPPKHSRRLAERLPDAELEIVPQAGHLSTLEQPERTNALIRRFLEKLGW